jgi:uncharacterized protein YggU (UPF0235/DUF167 family)
MYIRAKVTPGAKKERVVRAKENEFHIQVKEPAAQNLANTRVREIVAKEMGVPTGKARIIAGHRSPTKVISIE